MIFRYPGGKSKKSIQEKILKYFPEEYEEFRDCMVGGGGIFFAIPKDKKRWINDLNSDLMLVYSALKERPEEFISKCREIAPQKDGEELAPARDGKPFDISILSPCCIEFNYRNASCNMKCFTFIPRPN